MSAEKRKEIAEKIRKEVRDIYEYASDIQDERCEFNLRRDQLDDWRDTE